MNRREKEIRAYATALFEAVVEDTMNALRRVQERLSQDGDLRALLEDPTRDVQEKFDALRRALPDGVSPAVEKFLGVLISRQDIAYLDEIVDALRKEAETRGEAPRVADVISAVPLTEEERQTLEARLRERFGGNLTFSYRVDPDILGGLVVRVGDTLLDYSLRSRLEELRGRIEAVI